MTLPFLITLAIALPVLVFLALYLFAKSSVWFALRPRAWAIVSMVFGPIYAGVGLWEGRDGFGLGNALFLVGGALFFFGGLYHWFRGQSVKLE